MDMSKELTQEELDFLWSLMPKWVKELPEEEDPEHGMIYGTLSRQGDIDVHRRVVKLLNQPETVSTEEVLSHSKVKTHEDKVNKLKGIFYIKNQNDGESDDPGTDIATSMGR